MLDVGASVRKNAAARKPILGQRTSATPVPASSAISDERRRNDIAHGQRAGKSVVEHERAGPEAEPQIAADHLNLIEQVDPRSDRHRRADRRAGRVPDERGEHDPCRRQARVESTGAAATLRRASRTRRPSRRARPRAERPPSTPSTPSRTRTRRSTSACHLALACRRDACRLARVRTGLPGSNRAVQRQQEEQRHQRFAALRDVVDDFALQRMHQPEQRDDHGGAVRRGRAIRSGCAGRPAIAGRCRRAGAHR